MADYIFKEIEQNIHHLNIWDDNYGYSFEMTLTRDDFPMRYTFFRYFGEHIQLLFEGYKIEECAKVIEETLNSLKRWQKLQ